MMQPSEYKSLIAGFRRKRILVLGDVMLDRFIWGNVSRISPEAPVPVVNVERESTYPGGAANVARNLVPFAGQVHLLGMIGTDDNGTALANILSDGGINATAMLRDESMQTVTKTRIIARQQQVVRIDRERIAPVRPAQVEEVRRILLDLAGDLDGLIIEDYGKGFITQELADAVIPVAREAGLVVTVDPNPNNRIHWQGVTAVKPNRLEAFREVGVSDHGHGPHEDPSRDDLLLHVGNRLLEYWGTEMVQITLGEQGMMLFQRDRAPHHIPTRARGVFDVSGAGDTAIALLTLALAAGSTPVQAAEISNFASGVVVGKLGTATLTPDELLNAIRSDLPEPARPDAHPQFAKADYEAQV